jgi:uncharacterized protein with ParB-like and HNH nuclease domain
MQLEKPLFRSIKQLTRYPSYQVDTDWTYLIDACIPRYIEKYNLNLNPDFQRAHVWTEDKQIAFVEFSLKGGKSARNLFFNCVNWNSDPLGEFVLVDGKQRLEAITAFMQNRIKVFGYYRKEFTDKLPSQIDVRVHINNLKTRQEVLQWYLDMNTGGVIHTNEEIEKVRKMLGKETIAG